MFATRRNIVARCSRPECATECAMLSGTTWHSLAQRGTTARPECSPNRRHVAQIGTTWHDLAQPGAASSSPAGPTTYGGVGWGLLAVLTNGGCECAMDSFTTWRSLAQPGTSRHSLARLGGRNLG